MCGIFGIINDDSNKAPQAILDGLRKLEYRGYDSWGIAVIPDDSEHIEVEKHKGKISGALTSLPNSSIGIGHTRWATHGGVTDENAHPHMDCNKKIAVIHNGIVENYQDLKQKLLQKNHHFTSETDTEVIAHLIEEEMKNTEFTKAVFEVFNQLVGSNAIVVLDLNSKKIVTCRNGSPLAIGIGKNQYFLASDVTPFLPYTRDIYFVNDGEGVELTQNGVRLFDLQRGLEKVLTTQKIDWKVEDAEKGGFPHFLLKEIMEQKNTIPKTAVINDVELIKISDILKKSSRIILTGCGTAYYCALASKYFFASNGIDVHVYGAYEFLPFSRFCDEKTVFIAVSQSGETADTLIAAKAAKAKGAYIVAVVNARGSTLERLADSVLPVGAGPEIAVVSTKAFTSQLATLYLLALASAGKLDAGKINIKTLGENLNKWLTDSLLETIVNLAKNIMNQEHMYVIGKYLNYPAGLEFSLKIKETSYIHAEAFASGELKHGVITLIQKDTPCFVLAMNDEVKNEVLSSAAELKARGGRIIGIAPFSNEEFKDTIRTFDQKDLTIFPNIIVGQLLGYYLGIGRGADPDKPRNLAKSVTVK